MLIVVDLDNHITQLGNIFDIANLLASPEVTNVTVYYRSLGQFSADGGDYVFSIKDKGGCEVTTAVPVDQLQTGDSELFRRIAEMLLTKFDEARRAIREHRPTRLPLLSQ